MKRSLRKLLTFSLPPPSPGRLVTLYADCRQWLILLARISPAGSESDYYLDIDDIDFDWFNLSCTPRYGGRRSHRDYRPASLVDLRELIGAPAQGTSEELGRIRDGVIDEETLQIRSLIIDLSERGGRSIVDSQGCSWTPGRDRRCRIPGFAIEDSL